MTFARKADFRTFSYENFIQREKKLNSSGMVPHPRSCASWPCWFGLAPSPQLSASLPEQSSWSHHLASHLPRPPAQRSGCSPFPSSRPPAPNKSWDSSGRMGPQEVSSPTSCSAHGRLWDRAKLLGTLCSSSCTLLFTARQNPPLVIISTVWFPLLTECCWILMTAGHFSELQLVPDLLFFSLTTHPLFIQNSKCITRVNEIAWHDVLTQAVYRLISQQTKQNKKVEGMREEEPLLQWEYHCRLVRYMLTSSQSI